MPVRWNFFKIICLLQIVLTSLTGGLSLIYFIQRPGWGNFTGIIVMGLSLLLAVLGMQLLHRNYPEIPVAGRQKTIFNRLFLVNFLLLAVLFAFVFSAYNQLKAIAEIAYRSVWRLPLKMQVYFFMDTLILLLQMAILYGLFYAFKTRQAKRRRMSSIS